MALIDSNFDLPFNILRCGYVHYGVTDLKKAGHFYHDTIGLILTEKAHDTLYLRGLEEQDHHSYVLTLSDTPVVYGIGFKVATDNDLLLLEDHFKKLKLPTEWVTRHAQKRTLKTSSPQGIPLEFYASQEKAPSKLREYGLYQGCHPQRFDHFNAFTPDAQQSYEFFVRELGFRLSEYTITEKGEIWAAWMQRKGNVHDMALTIGDGPRLHHSAIWVPTPLQIIHLLDVMSTTGYVDNIERGPGRHGISNAFFLYITDPDGHRIEIYTSDYLTVDRDLTPKAWDLRDPQRQTLWGSAAPKSWFEKGSVFDNLPVKKSKVSAEPIVAG